MILSPLLQEIPSLYTNKYHDFFSFSQSFVFGTGKVFVLSSEAKGCVERLWKTLQGKLSGELRLPGVSDIEDANKVLPRLLSKSGILSGKIWTAHKKRRIEMREVDKQERASQNKVPAKKGEPVILHRPTPNYP
ncbi:MAG: hypothetical protein CSA35_09070 [Dethiosulfovibrio peptidovorans]|nr:MAG: hypothetical protein CSA35_09070 [Dethiosulfovibrio peptidovorans]